MHKCVFERIGYQSAWLLAASILIISQHVSCSRGEASRVVDPLHPIIVLDDDIVGAFDTAPSWILHEESKNKAEADEQATKDETFAKMSKSLKKALDKPNKKYSHSRSDGFTPLSKFNNPSPWNPNSINAIKKSEFSRLHDSLLNWNCNQYLLMSLPLGLHCMFDTRKKYTPRDEFSQLYDSLGKYFPEETKWKLLDAIVQWSELEQRKHGGNWKEIKTWKTSKDLREKPKKERTLGNKNSNGYEQHNQKVVINKRRLDGMEWDDRVINLPFFGKNTFKRHDVTLRETEGQHEGFSYEPSYDPMKEDSPKIVQLTPSWLATAMFSLGRHIGTKPQKLIDERQNIHRLAKSKVITDRNTIMKLNFRHVLRGA